MEPAGPHEKIAGYLTNTLKQRNTMEAEHINLIANRIEDLSNRVTELRGYL